MGHKALGTPIDTANFFSKITYEWMTPLLLAGYTRPITDDDLFNLSTSDNAYENHKRFDAHWKYEKDRNR